MDRVREAGLTNQSHFLLLEGWSAPEHASLSGLLARQGHSISGSTKYIRPFVTYCNVLTPNTSSAALGAMCI